MLLTNKISWTDFKALVLVKVLPMQYVEDATSYTIFIVDNGIEFNARIIKTTPASADQTDFEDNYKNTANAKSFARTQIVDPTSNASLTSTLNSGKQSLDVNVTNSFAAGVADKTAFTYGTTIESTIGGVFQDTSPTLTAGQQGAVRLTTNRAFHVNARDASGNEIDPRQIIIQQTTLPAAASGGTYDTPNGDPFGNLSVVQEPSTYARWGHAFFVTTNAITTGVSSEAAYFYLRNLAGNTKAIRLKKVYLSGPSSGNTVYKFYMNPTITTNGTALTITGARQTGQNVTTVTAFRAPTATSNGTVFKAMNVPTGVSMVVDFELNKWIEPGNTMLITSTQSLIGGFSSVDVEWIEE